jgi:hypothetical protein
MMPVFELAGLVSTADLPGLRDVWSACPRPAESFGAGPAAVSVPQWRARYPAAGVEALACVKACESRLESSGIDLERAESRLDSFLRGGTPGSPSTVGAGGTPEDELAGLLAEVGGQAHPAVAFWPGTSLLRRWDAIAAGFRRFLGNLERLVLNYVHVETRVGGRLVARTLVGWTGGFETWWGGDPGAGGAELHGRTVRLALRSRATLLNTFLAAIRGAVKIAAVLALPGGYLLALPIAWNFIRHFLNGT